jgi:ribosomal protein L21E
MKKQMTVSYQNRQGTRGDLPTAPKIVLANHLIKKLSGFSVGDKVTVEYSPNVIIITKLNSNLCQKQ